MRMKGSAAAMALFCTVLLSAGPAPFARAREVRGTVEWPEEWTVFILEPDDPLPPRGVLESVPETLAIAGREIPARRAKAQDGTHLDLAPLFGGVKINNLALVFLAIDAEDARRVTLGMGADWWFQAWLDGEEIISTLTTGNVAWPPCITNYVFDVNLRKGRNVLAVRFVSGGGSSVLTAGGPEELRRMPRERWVSMDLPEKPAAAIQAVSNHDFSRGGAGDPFVPEGWHNAEGRFAFMPGELSMQTARPISGRAALEINTIGSGDVSRKVYTPLKVDVSRLYEASFKGQYLGGTGYVSVSVRNAVDGSDTSFIQAVGDVTVRAALTTRAPKPYQTTYYNDIPRPYLVVQAHGEVNVILDDISIVPLADHVRQYAGWRMTRVPWAEDWQKGILSEEVATPHIAWGKPHAGGRLNVITVMPRWRHRWTVELAQRMDVSCAPVMFATGSKSKGHRPDQGLGLDYWIAGADGEPEIFRVERRALEGLSAPADCMVITGVSSREDVFIPSLAEKVLSKVEGGMGLVIAQVPFSGGYREGVWSKALNETNRVRPDAGYILPGAVNSSPEFYEYGRGRIAFLPEVSAPGADEDSRAAFEMEMSHVMKAMLWASRREPVVHIRGVSLRGGQNGQFRSGIARAGLPAAAEVAFSGPLTRPARLKWWFDDDTDMNADGGEATLATGGSTAVIEIPRLSRGAHWLHLQLQGTGGDVLDWNTAVVEVSAEPGIRSIELAGRTPPYYRAGDRMEGRVVLEGAAAEGHVLRLRLRDADGHLWREEVLEVAGRSETPFSFVLGRPAVMAHNIEVELSDPDGSVAVSRLEDIVILREREWYANDYAFFKWVSNIGERGYIRTLAFDRFRKAMDLTQVYGGHLPDVRRQARNNIRLQQYPTGGNTPPAAVDGSKLEGDKDRAPERSPCLNDPAYRLDISRLIQRTDVPKMKYGPVSYVMSTEINLLGHGQLNGKADADICFSEHCLESFRGFLREEYGGLPALNASWGTDFGDWGRVRPVVLSEALETGQIARWIDHRRHMDRVLANFWKFKIEEVRKHDPEALAMVDNPRSPTSWSGVDYQMLLDEVVAGAAMPRDLLRSFVPDERRHLNLPRTSWWGPAMIANDPELFGRRLGDLAWVFLLQGARGVGFFAGSRPTPDIPMFKSPITPCLRVTEAGRWLLEPVARIRTGIDRLVFESEFNDSGIGVLYSRSSEHAATAWQRMHGGETAAGRLDAFGQYRLFTRALELLDYQYRAVSERQVIDGELEQRGIRLLILPFSQAIDAETALRIREFVAAGGAVIADVRPAMADRHGHRGEHGRLDEVFGVRHETAWESYRPAEAGLKLGGEFDGLAMAGEAIWVIAGPTLELAGAVQMGEAGGRPAMLVHRYGKGRAVLLNCALLAASADMLQMMGNLLGWAGLRPVFSTERLEVRYPGERYRPAELDLARLLAPEDLAPDDPEYYMYAEAVSGVARPTLAHYVKGGTHTFAFWYSYSNLRRGIGTERIRVTPPAEGHIYNLRTNDYLGLHGSFEQEIPLESMNVYASVPYRIGRPAVRADVLRGQAGNPVMECVVRVSPGEAAGETHVVRLSLFGPGGDEWRDFSENIVVQGGVATHRFNLPLNAPAGTWRVTTREAISGLEGEATLTVR